MECASKDIKGRTYRIHAHFDLLPVNIICDHIPKDRETKRQTDRKKQDIENSGT